MFSSPSKNTPNEKIVWHPRRVFQPIASRRWSWSARGCIGAPRSHRARRGAWSQRCYYHGSNHMSGDSKDQIECLGIEASLSLRVPTRGQWRRRSALHFLTLKLKLALGVRF